MGIFVRPCFLGLVLTLCLAATVRAPVVLAQSEAVEQPDQLTESYQDWLVRCRRADADSDIGCEMVQQLTAASSGQTVLQLRIAPGGEDGAHIGILLVPLAILVQQPITLSVDGETLLEARVSSCVQAGCIAPFNIDQDQWTRLRSGGSLAVRLATAGTREIYEAALSLAGFTAASNRLTELSSTVN